MMLDRKPASHHPLSPRGEGRLAARLRRFEDFRLVPGDFLVAGEKALELVQRARVVRLRPRRLEEATRRLEEPPCPAG